jgi:S1-C subfamily serine protease
MHSDTAEKIADGQTFGDDGKPVTNPEGIQLTPADMFSPGDVITVTVGKSNPRQDAGLKIEEINGKYYIRKVPSGGLFAKTPVIAGDKILELNGKDSREYEKLSEMKKTIKDENRINVVVLRRDPDASESSASSVEFENLNVVTADGLQREGDDDYDTVGYDGHDCGCKWCPKCHKKSSGTD